MNDPRIAALAEALTAASFYPYRSGVDYGAGRPVEWRYLHEQERATMLADAAAILDALPPDWCGHIGAWKQKIEEQEAEIERLSDQIARQAAADGTLAVAFDAVRAEAEVARLRAAIDAREELFRFGEAEIARLRKIEEAAGPAEDVLNLCRSAGLLSDEEEAIHATLRAALKADRAPFTHPRLGVAALAEPMDDALRAALEADHA